MSTTDNASYYRNIVIVSAMISNFLKDKKQLFDRWSATYDWIIPSVYYQAIHQRLLTKVELPANPQVLDLGCGTGRLLNRLAQNYPDLQGTGLDFSAQMLRVARQNNQHHPRLIYVEGNAESLPFTEGQFNAVFNTISFLHYPNPQQVFTEVARVLAPGGKFYLVDITSRKQVSHLVANSPTRMRFYNQEQRQELGATAGILCLGHYYLLGPVLLSVFAKPE